MTLTTMMNKQIIWSAGSGQMTIQECLDCAKVLGLPPCGFEHSFLLALYGSMGEDRSGEIHVTDLTKCLRKACLDKTQPVVEAPHQMLNRFSGLAMHAFLEGKADTKAEAEMGVALDGVVGRVDTLNEDGILVDYKTVKEIYRDKLPYGEHEVQLNMYAYMLRKVGRPVNGIRLVYISRNGPSTCQNYAGKGKCGKEFEMALGELSCPVHGAAPASAHMGVVTIDVRMYSDAEMAEVFDVRRQSLQKALSMGAVPPAEPGWQCKWCLHTCDQREG